MRKVKRLYEQFKPQHYILNLKPDRDKMTFSGSVIINGHKTGRPTKRLTLHQKSLKITGAYLVHHTKNGDQEVDIARHNTHAAYDEVRLHTNQILPAGSYTLTVRFSGRITRAMNGIYPCFFKESDQEQKLIATQFESHHAREVFPCVDEPEAKATFDLTLTTPAADGEVVVSNTPIKQQQIQKNGRGQEFVTKFERTPHMSTYLLAFVFGRMKHLEAKTKAGVVVRTYATPNNVAHTAFALDCAVKILDFYNDYFGIDYPLPKCDMIALPDFASGAMENWGCITYREHALLVDPDNTSLASKQYVAMVVAHELAHQWFGNLVTMRWWTDLWLNEGFASWIEYMAVDHLFPEWKMWTQFIVDEQQQALKLDALEHTHPVEVPIDHPDEIRSIFDTISYSKGSSIIHMLYHYLGAENFKNGLRYYLKKHAHGNTDTIDLWQALEEASSKPVKKFMHPWTTRGGYPLLGVETTDTKTNITQKRFYLNSTHKKHLSGKHQSEAPWPVALLSGHANWPELITKDSLSIPTKPGTEVKINRGQSGFYRVNYSASHLENLGHQILRGRIGPIDRLCILADTFEAAKAGHNSTIEALHLLDSYVHENDSAVWDVIAGNLAAVRLVMNDDDIRENMKPYVRQFIGPQLDRLGWAKKPKESHFDSLLRPTILGMASVAENKKVVDHALNLFEKMHHTTDVPADLRSADVAGSLRGGGIDPDMRGVVYGTAARHGDAKTFSKLLQLHKNSNSSEERLNLAAAICGFKQPSLIKRALKLIDTDEVRLQDVAYWIVYSLNNRYARQATWQWVQEHWSWLHKELGNDLAFHRLPVFVARPQSDAKFLADYNAFFNKRSSPSLERSISQGREIIEWQSAWRKRDLGTVKAYFADHH